MAIQIGDVFGDYRVVGILGKGGMGKVYRVRSLLTEREEAMKVVLPGLDERPDLADRFLREIRVHASLEHPNIAGLRAAFRVEDRIAMIMELVLGDSLDDLLRNGPLQLATAVYYIDQVLSALHYAHTHGVIHRDIKPANILVTGPESGHPGMVKLTDFGIAHATGTGRLTGTGIVVGSLGYMSPEQIRAEPADARSDIYSLGLTFYQMVTGHRPIQADSEYGLINAQLSYIPPPPADLIPGLPRVFSDVVMRSIAKSPQDRFPGVLEFREALRYSLSRQATNQTSTATRPTEPMQAPQPVKPAQSPVPTQPPAQPAPPAAWDPAFLEKVIHELAPYIGPIAKVMVNRAAKTARNSGELVQTLAAEVPESDRKRFLDALQR
jgi:serine/threonine-protein kinase